MKRRVLVIDGHDGAGKTTLARRLAEAVGAQYVRPFGGAAGRRLMAAYKESSPSEVLKVGHEALTQAIQNTEGEALILDRGWLTVATLVPADQFAGTWTLWLPTVLAWCDEDTTRLRLSARAEREDEPEDWHTEFLAAYRNRLEFHPGVLLRTDRMDEEACLSELIKTFEALPGLAMDAPQRRPSSAPSPE
jgi:predicted kinase